MAIRKTSAEYFSHDADASEDEKVMYLETVFGFMGYALYFKMLERLCRSDNFEMKFGLIQRQVLARHFGVTLDQFNEFIVAATSCDVVAFRIDADVIWSDGLKKRMANLLEKRQNDAERIARKRAENAQKQAESLENKHNSLIIEDVAVTSEQYSKVKYSKVKESKEKKRKEKKIALAEIEKNTSDSEQKKEKPIPNSAGPLPTPDGWRPVDVEYELSEIQKDDLCRERFFRQCQIPIERYDTFVSNFALKVKTEKKPYSNRADFRSHFFNWSRTEYDHEQKQKSNGSPKLTFHSPDTIREGIEFAERFAAERAARKG